jgi:hypothetical protein
VGPGERSEPLDELGWLPVGETMGLEPLRPKILIVAAAAAGAGERAEEAVAEAVAETVAEGGGERLGALQRRGRVSKRREHCEQLGV